MDPTQLILLGIGTLLSIFAASYLFIGESHLFYTANSVYIGGMVALGVFSLYKSLLSSAFTPIGQGRVTLIIPVIIGLLSFARLTKARWLARFPIAILSGLGIGIMFGLIIRSQILSVITMTVNDVIVGSPDRISAVLMFVGIISVLTYFLYSARISKYVYSPTGSLRHVMKFGRLCLMASFGYLSGYIAVISYSNVANFIVVVLSRYVEALFGG